MCVRSPFTTLAARKEVSIVSPNQDGGETRQTCVAREYIVGIGYSFECDAQRSCSHRNCKKCMRTIVRGLSWGVGWALGAGSCAMAGEVKSSQSCAGVADPDF